MFCQQMTAAAKGTRRYARSIRFATPLLLQYTQWPTNCCVVFPKLIKKCFIPVPYLWLLFLQAGMLHLRRNCFVG